MRSAIFTALAMALLVGAAAVCDAAGVYTLAYWRQHGGGGSGETPENAGNADIRVFVFDEYGNPVPGVRVRYQWSGGETYDVTDERGRVLRGFQFAGNPCRVKGEDNVDPPQSTSDWSPWFYNHDSHRVWEVGFLWQDGALHPGSAHPPSPAGEFDLGIFDIRSWGGNEWLLSPIRCPSTYSLMYNTPDPADYSSGGCVEDRTSNVYEYGNTFVATYDRATAMRANPTKYSKSAGLTQDFRWAAQIFEGGPNGPPMGPKLILPFCYLPNDLKYIVSYDLEECPLKVGNTYYVAFTAADGTPLNAWELLRDVYPNGTLYRNGTAVPGRDLQAYVCGMTSKVANLGSVTGTITGTDGQPINEAAVVLNPTGKRIVTGKLGTYKCYNVPYGTYTATVSAPGFQSAQAQLTVNSSHTPSAPLVTNFALGKDAGPIRVLSTTGGAIAAGDQDVPISLTVASADGRDVFITSSGLTFWSGRTDVSGYFSVTPDAGNPSVVRGRGSAVLNFLVDSSPSTPSGSFTVQGKVEGNVNLQANGSFEADDYIPNWTGPTSWDWRSDDQASVARLSYQHVNRYEMTDTMPLNTDKVRVRWIAKFSQTSTDKKQGLRVYWPKLTGGQWRVQLNIYCRTHYMSIGNYGTGDTTYNFTLGKYYQIDATYWSSTDPQVDGKSKFIITPLEEPGKPVGIINGLTAASSTTNGGAFKWGCMTDTGTEEMSCREVSYWFEDDGNVIMERQWVAASAYPHPPTDPGQGYTLDSGNVAYQAMLPGAPWSADSLFNITTSDKKEGAKAVQMWVSPSQVVNNTLLSTGSRLPGGSSGLLPMMAVKPCTTYKVSFWYKQDHYTVNPGWLRLMWEEYKWDAAKSKYKPYYYHDNNPDWPSPGYLMPPFHWTEPEPVSHGEWRYVEYKLTTTSEAEYAEVQLRADKPSTAAVADVFWFDDFRLTELNPYADLDADSPGTLVVAALKSSVGDARKEPDGTAVKLAGIPVTGYPVGQSQRFYVEDADRSSGILVDKTGGSGDLNVVENDLVTLTGVLATVDGERVLRLPNVSNRTASAAPGPVAMPGRALGGTADGYTPGVFEGVGRNNVGLLVKVWGIINSVGSGYFYVDDWSGLSDGKGQGVKIISGGIPMQGGATFAVVTGFSSVEKSGGVPYRVVRPRRASDIVWY